MCGISPQNPFTYYGMVKPFLGMLGKAPSKPTKASLAIWQNGLGARPVHDIKVSEIHVQERFWSLWTKCMIIIIIRRLFHRNDIICYNVIIFLTTFYDIIIQWWSYTPKINSDQNLTLTRSVILGSRSQFNILIHLVCLWRGFWGVGNREAGEAAGDRAW